MADVKFHQRANVLIIGDFHVGKSTLINYQRTTQFDDTIVPTVEIEQSTVGVTINGKNMIITVKDSPGMKEDSIKYGRFVFPEFQHCAVIVFVYDKTHKPSFDQIKYLKQMVDELVNRRMVCILVGNKCDKANSVEVSFKDGNERCCELKMDFFIEISAKKGTNVEELFREIALRLIDMEPEFGSTQVLHQSENTQNNCQC